MLWTLILSLTVVTLDGASTHSITVPNISSKEACRTVGQQHVNKYQQTYVQGRGSHENLRVATFAAVYTCVEQGKINGL